jgi:gluconate 2-dehydrogenase gamma chain
MGLPAFDTSTPPESGLAHFSEAAALAVAAIAERIIPGDPGRPGAIDAGVVTYIDRTLAGFEDDLQALYDAGLKELDRRCAQDHGAPFTELTTAAQDDLLRPALDAETSADGDLLAAFLATVRRHTIEGFFSDPMYGGNRDAVGWRLVGFPGAHWSYTVEDMRLGVDPASIPIKTLADLRTERRAEGADRA